MIYIYIYDIYNKWLRLSIKKHGFSSMMMLSSWARPQKTNMTGYKK